ncbi:MAG: hypothetical protein QOI03_1599 [Solirubrobacteraceae bacterium]|nr:hypothetical protein [Solirubrobacteraceae bacterium]
MLAVDTASTSYQIGQFAGLAFVLVLAFAALRRAATTGFGSRAGGPLNGFVALAAVVIAAGYLAYSAKDGMFESGAAARGTQEAWSSQEGVDMKAGFIASCGQNSAGRTSICECVFAHIASTPPYNTPKGFEANLLPAVKRFVETRQVSALPATYVSAVRECAAAAGA